MLPTQRPTCTGVRIRSAQDANVIFHAVALELLPLIVHRLDAADRAALCPGCVYVWEERSPDADATKVGMERFTEGRHWHQSRVRDDFLVYHEKDPADSANAAAEAWNYSRQAQSPFSPSLLYSSYGVTDSTIRARNGSRLIKQTYSAWVKTPKGLRKWHLNAYYSEDSLEFLRTVDEIPLLARLDVPHECYQRARTTKYRESDASRHNSCSGTGIETRTTYSSPYSNKNFPSIGSPQFVSPSTWSPSEYHPAVPAHSQRQEIYPFPVSLTASPTNSSASSTTNCELTASNLRLVPLENLLGKPLSPRERSDDELLRSFRLQ